MISFFTHKKNTNNTLNLILFIIDKAKIYLRND